jgi:hypothetical protein
MKSRRGDLSTKGSYGRVLLVVAAVGILTAPVSAQNPLDAALGTAAPKPPAAEAAPAATAPAAPAAAAAAKADDDQSLERQFTNFLHFIKLGRFDIADAEGAALLSRPDLDPAKLLTYADEQKQSVELLILMASHTTVGESVQGVLGVIQEGRHKRRTDPERIQRQLDRLGGSPRSVFLATENLRSSGEYAIPWVIEYLRKPEKKMLHPRILNAYPEVGRWALNPTVMALRMADDDTTRRFVIDSLGKLGYLQAVPYLKQIMETEGAAEHLKVAASQAIRQITQDRADLTQHSASSLFVDLAERYYNDADQSSLRADPREAAANVWYWRDNFLVNTPIPTKIFNEIMCMRCCEEALRLEPGNKAAVALWLAANFRREAQLGMNVESADPAPEAADDATKPDGYPRSIVFARSAGPQYNLMVLARALRDVDPGVALGAVAALSVTAGASSLVEATDPAQPLTQALTFPDLVVRIKAALALGKALPRSPFHADEKVVPVLAEALAQTGKRTAVVIDPKQSGLNDVQGKLRAQGFEVIGEASFLKALERARAVPFVDAIYVASDIEEPRLTDALTLLRKEVVFAATPVVVMFEPQDAGLVEGLVLADARRRLGRLLPGSSAERLVEEWRRISAAVGRLELSAERALTLALDAAETLRGIAVSRSTVYDFNQAEAALIAALLHPAEALRIRAASVLALALSPEAQHAVARVALDTNNTPTLRAAAFGSLAESAKNNGRLLGDEQLNRLIEQAVNETDMTVRAAASKALGAMNAPTNEASKIIRGQYAG